MRKRRILVLLLCATAGLSLAQFRRDQNSDRSDVPQWELNKEFSKDVFTFVRIKYSSGGRIGGYYSGDWRWRIDSPDSDLNLSYRLQQITSLKVNPDFRVLELTDKELFDYPFIYIVEPGDLLLSEDEVKALRRYLLSGGFLMVDDFWGEVQYANFYREIKRVLPEREPVELPMDHHVFNCVFPLNKMEKNQLQVPNVNTGTMSQRTHVTWEYHEGEACRDVHIKGIFDDKGRMMVVICHNTDLGDGWEWEGNNQYYFREFSEKIAYPLGINIIFYAMTH